MTFPNLFIPGVARSATTYVASVLAASPEIFSPEPKELHYFASRHIPDPLHSGDPFRSYDEFIVRDRNEYLSRYTEAGDVGYMLDASPSALFYGGCASDIKKESPGSKIIILLRNPVERAFSQYKMNVRLGKERLSFEDALKAENERLGKGFFMATAYLKAGLYHDAVSGYLDVFGRKDVLVVLFDELIDNEAGTFGKIFEFLGVEFKEAYLENGDRHYSGFPRRMLLNKILHNPMLRKTAKYLVRGKSMRKQLDSYIIRKNDREVEMNPGTKDSLYAYFESDIDKLGKLIQTELSNWKGR